MTTIVVDVETLEFVNVFPVGANGAVVFGPNPQVSLETPEDPSVLVAIKDPETSEVTLTQDPAKVQAKLDAAWTQLRAERNARLAATDWVALADAHLSQDRKDAWFAYRQELRDLPDLVTDSMLVATSLSDSVPWPLDPTQAPVVQATGSRLSSLLDAAQ